MYNTKYTRKIRDELKKTQIKNINSLNRNNFINEDLRWHTGYFWWCMSNSTPHVAGVVRP
jgi:hypothetical protein